ncbi:DUF6907 domain-containing protein [Streptomyces longwoodensis]|uniref:DUF6907 domain-containing protein n=1 Tax=Streptomyces longwoodensis TaxID=68231 RepID=UPI0033D1BE4A
MSAEPRTVTLRTSDRGDVTIPEPAWCIGHALHDPETAYVDLGHHSARTVLNFQGRTIGEARITQTPYTEGGTRAAYASVYLLLDGADVGPAGLYDFAGRLDAHADQLRALADQLAAILDGGDR